MKQTSKQTHKIVAPSRYSHSESATISTKRTRTVIIPRENIDTPPTITDHVRELARLIRNTNSLVARFTIPGLEEYAPMYMSNLAEENDAPMYKKRIRTPIENRPAIKMHFYTASGNFWKWDARVNQPYEIKPHYRPLWVCSSAPVKGKERGRWYTASGNVDKPNFRHESMYLFDILSEDYAQ